GQRVVFEVRASERQQSRVDIAFRDRAAATIRVLTGEAHGSPFDWSRQPDISDDGQVVVFSSASATLVPAVDANGRQEDVYSLQLATGLIARESTTSAGVQPAAGVSYLPSVSSDGRFIAFASTAALDDEQPSRGDDDLHQVFVRDRSARTTTRISRTPRGRPAAGDSTMPSISADGRYVAFSSDGGNIIDGDRNRARDVFLVDRTTMATILVSRAAVGGAGNGVSLSPVISADGRFVVFQSDASNLVCASRCPAGQSDVNLLWDVFLFDRVTGTIARMSEDELGGWMEWSAGPAVDGTGRAVAFSSRHPTDALDQRHDLDLFIRKR
ncbi:MAG TPA: hypothetical protein VFJ02_03400, partial [Vicinamibacterales bacterium]|nr:hypothetical protein [Vicinamibacterales bacterium]